MFDIVLSIEKDRFAHATLELRAFFRHLTATGDASDYYRYIRSSGQDDDDIDRETLFSLHPESAAAAKSQTWHEELAIENREAVARRIRKSLCEYPGMPWVLLGGPPCQAYSMVGRSRMRREQGEGFEQDKRHTLYQEYLAILKTHKPPVFLMENVKGLLSSQLQSKRIFDKILEDLRDAAGNGSYTLFPFVKAQNTCRQRTFASNGFDREPTP